MVDHLIIDFRVVCQSAAGGVGIINILINDNSRDNLSSKEVVEKPIRLGYL